MIRLQEIFYAHAQALPWDKACADLVTQGAAIIPDIFNVTECTAIGLQFGFDDLFSKHVDMEKKKYGKGEYKYFKEECLPHQAATLREIFYERTVDAANDLLRAARKKGRHIFGVKNFPPAYEDFAAICAEKGQGKNACLVLQYPAGGYNALHQDQYGKVVYPFQLAIPLTPPQPKPDSGCFQLEEKGEVRLFNPGQGAGIIFPSMLAADAGMDGVNDVRHGVSPISVPRKALGIIAHGLD